MVSLALGALHQLALWLLASLLLLGEYLDWYGRLEVLEVKHPKLHRFFNNRPLRLVLLLLVFSMLAGDLKTNIDELQVRAPAYTWPDPSASFIAPLVRENFELRHQLATLTKHAPKNSLRHQTIELVNEINLFWADRSAPTQQPIPNPTTDADRAHNAQLERDWKEVMLAYKSKQFNERIIGITKQYEAKGVLVGYLERSAEQPDRLIGALPYGGYSLDNCAQFMSDLCQLRELAFHVGAYDERIDSSKF